MTGISPGTRRRRPTRAPSVTCAQACMQVPRQVGILWHVRTRRREMPAPHTRPRRHHALHHHPGWQEGQLRRVDHRRQKRGLRQRRVQPQAFLRRRPRGTHQLHLEDLAPHGAAACRGRRALHGRPQRGPFPGPLGGGGLLGTRCCHERHRDPHLQRARPGRGPHGRLSARQGDAR